MPQKTQLHKKLHECKRILIIGDPGSGKNYLGEHLAPHFKLPFKDIDNIIWERKFDIGRSREERERMVITEAKKDKWLFVGVPAVWARQLVSRAQVIIILKESLLIESIRIFLRFFKRKIFC